MKEARINMWSLLTTVADRDFACSEQAKELIGLTSGVQTFGSELDFTVDELGIWTIRVFCHDGSNDQVELRILPSGHVSVERKIDINDLQDIRKISF